MLESVAEHIEHAVHVARVVQRKTELLFGLYGILTLEACPLAWLRALHEVDESLYIQPQMGVVCVRSLGITAIRR